MMLIDCPLTVLKDMPGRNDKLTALLYAGVEPLKKLVEYPKRGRWKKAWTNPYSLDGPERHEAFDTIENLPNEDAFCLGHPVWLSPLYADSDTCLADKIEVEYLGLIVEDGKEDEDIDSDIQAHFGWSLEYTHQVAILLGLLSEVPASPLRTAIERQMSYLKDWIKLHREVAKIIREGYSGYL